MTLSCLCGKYEATACRWLAYCSTKAGSEEETAIAWLSGRGGAHESHSVMCRYPFCFLRVLITRGCVCIEIQKGYVVTVWRERWINIPCKVALCAICTKVFFEWRVISPQLGVPQTARSWQPSPWVWRSWRPGPNTSPDQWPSQGIHTLCYKSKACTLPGRRQSSPGNKHMLLLAQLPVDLKVQLPIVVTCHQQHCKVTLWSLTMQRMGVIKVQLHFIQGFGL